MGTLLGALSCLQELCRSYTLRMQESMRLWSVAPSSTRCLERAAVIGGFELAAGTLVQVAFHGVHRNPAVWDRPDECLPVGSSTQDPVFRSIKSSAESGLTSACQ